MLEVLLFLGGLFIGIGVTIIFYSAKSTSGILRIDHSNQEKDVYRFEIKDLDKLNKKSKVILKVDHNADLSQK